MHPRANTKQEVVEFEVQVGDALDSHRLLRSMPRALLRRREVGGVQLSTTTGTAPWISGCPADLFHRLVRFDEKQNLGSRQH